MGGIKNIIEGHINEFLGNTQAVAEPRRAICRVCPLYHINQFWGWAECNSKLYLNPETDDVSTKPKEGYKNGCGCKILQKTAVPAEKCPLGKW